MGPNDAGGDGDGVNLVEALDCDGDEGDCQVDFECKPYGQTTYTQWSVQQDVCPNYNGGGQRADFLNCSAYAADLALPNSCKKALVCAATNSTSTRDAYQ